MNGRSFPPILPAPPARPPRPPRDMTGDVSGGESAYVFDRVRVLEHYEKVCSEKVCSAVVGVSRKEGVSER